MEKTEIIEDKIKLADSLKNQLKEKDISIRISFDLQGKIEDLDKQIAGRSLTELEGSNELIKERSLEKQEQELDAFISIAQDMLSGKFHEKCTLIHSTSFTKEEIEESKKKNPWFYGNV